ncbi:MAG: hypothetical protein J3K34DRAFT_95524 [Monoraphidium minutum]|nr:MAG: hypothetical protein J3K34DRAFT_95524 [Monoraphidium minutum]
MCPRIRDPSLSSPSIIDIQIALMTCVSLSLHITPWATAEKWKHARESGRPSAPRAGALGQAELVRMIRVPLLLVLLAAAGAAAAAPLAPRTAARSQVHWLLAGRARSLAADAPKNSAPAGKAAGPSLQEIVAERLVGNPGAVRVKSYASPQDTALKALAAQQALTKVGAPDSPKGSVSIPASYLGLSVDLGDIEGVASRDYITLIKLLTSYDTGPMYFRVGAYSADRLIKPWPASVYKALTTLHTATGVKFIMGANQHAEDPSVTDAQVQRSLKLLPAGSIVAFGVGNEPDMYALAPSDGLPGSTLPKSKNWLRDSWIDVSKKVYRAAFEATGRKKMLVGPDWSDGTMGTDKLQWWLNGVKGYLSMVTVHYYGGDIRKDKTIAALLDDARMVKKINNVRALVKVARDNNNLPLRITEVATISYGGKMGISDTAGAAIWSLDIALELAYAGSTGIHFHQVLSRNGNANYNAIAFNADSGTVRIKLPLYGYLMLQQALAGGADIVGRAISGSGCKAWLLRGRKDGSLRAVVINKNGDGKECAADVALTSEQMKRQAELAEAHYIYAPAGLDEVYRIYYSNSHFTFSGAARLQEEMTVPIPRRARGLG